MYALNSPQENITTPEYGKDYGDLELALADLLLEVLLNQLPS